MIKKVEAFETADGSIFSTEEKAVRHEVRKDMTQLLVKAGFNEGQIRSLTDNVDEVTEVLLPLMPFIKIKGVDAKDP